ncbi:MAG: hypothetical protein KatS3mg102_0716 [Planctomycetota bacterium]|nr:MAG: hypothetical protein KatS3mg102_0716 [Planctomycetota bacterium]
MILKPPNFLFIETTTECNLRCKQCHMWMSREPADSLRTEEKIELVRNFGLWAPSATVVLTGGETMRKRQEFFGLSRACRNAGLRVAANTNGTYIRPCDFDELLESGPHYLVFSLDSHKESVHDWIRGRRGTFRQVTEAIRGLVDRKQRLGAACDVKIMTNTILFDRNVSEIEELVSALTDLGVDGIMFQVLSRTFLFQGRRDVFFERHVPRDLNAFDRAVDRLLALKECGAPIVTPANDLRWMKLYVRNPDFIGEQVCGSGERNMMVDQRGDVQLCFSMRALVGGKALGNVRESSLQEIWESAAAARARSVMSNCRKNCGMLNCHRRIGS